MASAAATDSGLKEAMDASLKAYAAGDRRFFDFLQDDVRVFNLNSVEPMVGRKRFESAFGPNFANSKRKVKVINSDLQQTGEQAVLAQTLEIGTADGIAAFVRQTVIWSSVGGKWKMSHIHNALVGQPIATAKLPASVKGIQVLNERIATVAAAVGVAQ